jgi:hypothetical protein
MLAYKFCKALGGEKMDLRFLLWKDISSKRTRRCEGVGGPINGGVDCCEERFPEDAIIAGEVCCNKLGRVVECGGEGNRG